MAHLELSGKRLLREPREMGYVGCYTRLTHPGRMHASPPDIVDAIHPLL